MIWIVNGTDAEMKKIRFYIARVWMLVGLFIMPIEAGCSVHYNTRFLHGHE